PGGRGARAGFRPRTPAPARPWSRRYGSKAPQPRSCLRSAGAGRRVERSLVTLLKRYQMPFDSLRSADTAGLGDGSCVLLGEHRAPGAVAGSAAKGAIVVEALEHILEHV